MQQRPEEILKKAREKKKYTQQEVADKIGMTLRQYNKYEAGEFPKYKSENIKTIDSLLGTKLHELIYEQKQEQEEQNKFFADTEQIRALTAEVKELVATVYVLKHTVAQLASKSSGKEIGLVQVELDRAIKEKVDILFDIDKKHQTGL